MATFRRNRLASALIPLLGMSLFSTAVFAQDTSTTTTPESTTPAPAKDTKQLQQVVVTGTRATNRTVAESISPIDVLNKEDLAASGASDLATALSTLLPSLDFPRPAISDGSDAARPATLRGLSPDDVLVLVDGKRYHTGAMVNYLNTVGRGSAPVDLNSIPMSAIDHIEVLRDGAAAQYGSDAIAGVINIVLKHGPTASDSGNSVSVGGGGYSKGDGAQNNVSGSLGVPLGGPLGSAPGWLRLSWNYESQMNTNRAANTDVGTNLPGVYGTTPFPYERYGDPALKVGQVAINFGYDVTPNVELYGFLIAGRRDAVDNGYYRGENNYRNVYNFDGYTAGTLNGQPALYPNLVSGTSTNPGSQAIYADGFLPQFNQHINDVQGVFGIKGKTDNGWNWDASVDYGENDMTFDIQDTLNVNEFYATGHSPTYFNAGEFKTKEATANVDISKEFTPSFLTNPLTVAFGAEYRKDEYDVLAGDPDSYYLKGNIVDPVLDGGDYVIAPGGSQVYPGTPASAAGDFTRHNSAIYADLENDLTDKLSLGVAGRFEDYSDAGTTRSGKISLRFQATDTFALRGTVSNGFRAPSLAQEDYQSTVTAISGGQLVQTGTFRVDNPVAQALGAKPLTPEKSVNYGVGAVWTPINDFNATVDLYQIRINHQIVYTDDITVTPTLANGYVGAVQYFTNGADTRTNGADMVLNYRIDLGSAGKLNLVASGNWNQTSILSVSSPDFGRVSQGLLTVATPRTKYVVGGDWLLDGFDLHANVTRYGTVTRWDTTPATDQTFDARWLLDMSASYNLAAWTFTVGADNLTNVYPTKASPTNGQEDYADGLQYSTLSPFGFNGRYVYGKVTYRF